MRYEYTITKEGGEAEIMKERNKYMKKIMLFAHLVSEIDISRYKQKAYVNIVKAIYWEIFGKKIWDTNTQ